MPFLCWAWTGGEEPTFFSQSVVHLAFLLGVPHVHGSAFTLSSLPCFRSFDTFARLLITNSSSSFGLLAGRKFIASHGVLEEVIDRVSRFLDMYEVVKLHFVLLERLLDSTLSLPAFSIHPSNTHPWPLLITLALLSPFLALSIFERLPSPESGHLCILLTS